MPSYRRAPAARPARPGQQGQALVEFTFIFVFVMFLLAGLVDVGGLLDVHVALVYASRQGARTGAVIGDVAVADCAIVGAVHSVLANQPNLTLNEITIYQAGADGHSTGDAQYYPGTADCQAGTIIDITSGLPISPLSGSNWDPTTRNISPYVEDSLGVKLDYSYQFRLNLLGAGAFSASDYAVYPMDPSGGPQPIPTPTP